MDDGTWRWNGKPDFPTHKVSKPHSSSFFFCFILIHYILHLYVVFIVYVFIYFSFLCRLQQQTAQSIYTSVRKNPNEHNKYHHEAYNFLEHKTCMQEYIKNRFIQTLLFIFLSRFHLSSNGSKPSVSPTIIVISLHYLLGIVSLAFVLYPTCQKERWN